MSNPSTDKTPLTDNHLSIYNIYSEASKRQAKLDAPTTTDDVSIVRTVIGIVTRAYMLWCTVIVTLVILSKLANLLG
tara:strand:- start:4909 stop:5139 length:231 start_codon:yes stop_codon:yes gene_type:complete